MTSRFESTFMLRVANLAPVGNGDLIVTNLTLQSLNNSFSFDEELVFPFSVQAQTHEDIPIKFKPDALGERTCTVRVESNIGNYVLSINPSGTDCSYITLDQDELNLTNEYQQVPLEVSSDCTWTVDELPEWITLDPVTGSPTTEGDEFVTNTVLSVAENLDGPERSHEITFTNLTNKTTSVLIIQAQSSPIPSITSSTFEDVCL